jgi:ornithine carbamoyltransferase
VPSLPGERAMPIDLRHRSFLSLLDLSPDEIGYLIDLAAELKAAKRAGAERPRLRGKNIALIFQKPSTRTRAAFEVAAHDQGAHVSYLAPGDTQMGKKESTRDTARVLGRLYDGIEYRGYGQAIVEELARYAGVPVWNGLTDEFHPTQTLADLMTMREHLDRPLGEARVCFVGHAENNTSESLMIGAAKLGLDMRLAAPSTFWPRRETAEHARAVAGRTGGRLTITEDIGEAVHGSDFVYTDVWLSMGEAETIWQERIERLLPYQVTAKVMAASGNPRVKFMHCLPAFHDRETEVGARIGEQFGLDAMEVTDEVFESPASIVFDQAENRMHTIKALLVATIG